MNASKNSIAGTGEISKRDGALKMVGFRKPMMKVAIGKIAAGRNAEIKNNLRILKLYPLLCLYPNEHTMAG